MNMPITTQRAVLSALLACLAGCASIKGGPVPDAAYIVMGEGGAAMARAITRAAACPAITIDGRVAPMTVRAPLQPIVARAAAAPGREAPPSSPVLTCEATIPAATAQAAVAGEALPLPRAEPTRIVVIGDTGCRLNAKETQDCSDPDAYPFAHIAAAAAAWHPDLVVHVGDYQYREAPCPAGRAGCAGSPWGYGWDAWNADFFAPARALLRAAPWVMARGNHESCARAGQGYWRFLDPRALQAGRDCNAPADDASGDFSDPYAVPLGGGAQLVVFDSSATSYKGFAPGDPRRAKYADTWRKMELLTRQARYNIAVDHHPLFGFGALEDRKTHAVRLFGGDLGLQQAFGALDPGLLPPGVQVLLSGHVHLWEQVSFAGTQPTQFVSGFSGTAEDIVPLPASVPPGETPAPGAVVEHMSSWIDGFGFMTMERTGPDAWLVTVHDRDGLPRNRCTVAGNKSACELAKVK